jgi:hypothetical protein
MTYEGPKPTDKEVIKEGMHTILSDYKRKNAITRNGLPKSSLSLFAGYGQAYSSAFGTDGRDVGPTNISWGLDMMWGISGTPLSLGVSAVVNENVVTIEKERENIRKTQMTDIFSPTIGWNKIIANRHVFGLGLGVGLVSSHVSEEKRRYFLAENAALSYGYRIGNDYMIGIKAHAYTFNDRFTQNNLPKPIVPLWSVSLCYTMLSF